jgi:hypothetical protein
MPYMKRTDSRIAVTIDGMVWNIFQELAVELSVELPANRFVLLIPREIEIESAAIPDRDDKLALKTYISRQMREADIHVSAVFGFEEAAGEPKRHGGFGFGTFQSDEARAYYTAIGPQHLIGKPGRGSHLTHNEGDAAIGAASLASVVLTCDVKKSGPIREAVCNHGGKVLDMRQYHVSRQPLATLIERCHDTP